jgi:hypothetical protein
MTTREIPQRFLVAFSLAGEQRELVRAIAESVEKMIGSNNVFLDEWFEYYIAGDDADLKLQEIYGEQCELAVVCVSKPYAGKPWTQAEHRAIRARQMQWGNSVDRPEQFAILPIRVGEGDVPGILFNAIVPDVREYTAEKAAQLIVDRLWLIRPDLNVRTGPLIAGLSWPEPPESLHWPMADHSGVREAFARLLARDAAWRFLSIRGSSETGKSHITRQMLDNALLIPELACGRFDFKGTTGMDDEVRAFVQDLGVPEPPASPRLNERLGHILSGLKQRARPALLVFDTYEHAGEAQDWVEKQLLPSLIRATWLRVVVAGQRVPESAGAVGASVARGPLQLLPPQPADWYEFGKQYRPDLTLADVESACRLTNKASLLKQLLVPTT